MKFRGNKNTSLETTMDEQGNTNFKSIQGGVEVNVKLSKGNARELVIHLASHLEAIGEFEDEEESGDQLPTTSEATTEETTEGATGTQGHGEATDPTTETSSEGEGSTEHDSEGNAESGSTGVDNDATAGHSQIGEEGVRND